MTRILIADDHAIVRKGLVQIIADTMDLQVAAEAATADDVFALVRSQAFDVVVLDLNMGDASGLEVLKTLKAEFEDLPVLILSVHPEQQYAVRMLRAGASGYLNKDSAPELLVKALRRVADGRRYVSPAVAEELLTQMDSDVDGPPHERLSDREFQVMRLLASGNSATEIAEMLSLSVKTISTYRSRILEKMNFSNNAEITRYAIKNELVL
ncbi:MAG: response regulator transcription factor [Bacteroidota bacterium]